MWGIYLLRYFLTILGKVDDLLTYFPTHSTILFLVNLDTPHLPKSVETSLYKIFSQIGSQNG